MEDLLNETQKSLTPPGNHDSQMRLVVLLGLLVIAIVVAVFVFDTARSPKDTSIPNTQTPPPDITAPVPTSDMSTSGIPETAQEPRQLAGYVAGVITSPESDAKWIELHVQMPKADAPALAPGEELSTLPETETRFYKFYLSEDVEGVDTIVGGETVLVSFYGEPSEEEYMGVSELTRI